MNASYTVRAIVPGVRSRSAWPDGLTLDLPTIDGGFAAWRDAGMPVG
jgi:hypothetical protein